MRNPVSERAKSHKDGRAAHARGRKGKWRQVKLPKRTNELAWFPRFHVTNRRSIGANAGSEGATGMVKYQGRGQVGMHGGLIQSYAVLMYGLHSM